MMRVHITAVSNYTLTGEFPEAGRTLLTSIRAHY